MKKQDRIKRERKEKGYNIFRGKHERNSERKNYNNREKIWKKEKRERESERARAREREREKGFIFFCRDEHL